MNIFLTLKEMLHYWYWEEFSYADNRFCMFLEKFFPPKVVRWFAFHCYCLTMLLLFMAVAAMLFSYAGKLIDILLNRGIVR